MVLVLLFLTGPLQYLPHGVLAGIVFNIAAGLIDIAGLRAIRRASPGEFWLAVTTAATVTLVGVAQGILLAVPLALLRHVRPSYRPHTAVLVPDAAGRWFVVDAGAITDLDYSAARDLRDLCDDLKGRGITLARARRSRPARRHGPPRHPGGRGCGEHLRDAARRPHPSTGQCP